MRKDEIDRAIILIYKSRNAHGFINYSRPVDALDSLPMEAIRELKTTYDNLSNQISEEIDRRVRLGQTVYSPNHYEGEK